jgi:hypothetical protein
VSRRSVLSMRAGGSVVSVIPLRGYFVSAGGALLLLLLAADWLLPAPEPSRLAGSKPAMPPIRIHSDVKRPELVVIDTNQPLPVSANKEITMARSQFQTFDAADAAQATGTPLPVDEGESRPATSMTSAAQHLDRLRPCCRSGRN